LVDDGANIVAIELPPVASTVTVCKLGSNRPATPKLDKSTRILFGQHLQTSVYLNCVGLIAAIAL